MNHEQDTKVFVYGTLKPGEVNYDQYCASKVVEEIRAIAFGELFDLPIGY
ncbi:MAG: gamma-glutamylcyclotransferase, partial [Merismopedia sp. SIO2A8]|nr:gamma-glutamylcyclotransferase [Merismopedia sp. SIO2A8]